MTSAASPCDEAGIGYPQQETLLRNTCDMVAPTWPLDQWIAVNPFWGLRHLPPPHVDALMRVRGGFRIVMPPRFYHEAWIGSRIRPEDLRSSLQESGIDEPCDSLVRWLDRQAEQEQKRPFSILDTFAASPEEENVTDRVAASIAEGCAAFFDDHQSGWSVAGSSRSLYRFWLNSARDDRFLDARCGVPGARKHLQSVPDDSQEALGLALGVLGAENGELESLSHSWLLRLNGWASWCRGVDWRASLDGRESDYLLELLAIALTWEVSGLACASDTQIRKYRHQRASSVQQAPTDQPDWLWVWQRAFEIGYQRALWRSLLTPLAIEPAASDGPVAQAVFCIDVRSEVVRRHLEAMSPGVRTLGFAGFFGLPLDQQALGPRRPVRRLPGLLGSRFRLVSGSGDPCRDRDTGAALRDREITRSSVRKAKYSSLSTFTLVETTGLAWAWKLLNDSLRRRPVRSPNADSDGALVHRHDNTPLSVQQKADLVAGMLRGMSLVRDFAPLVVFVGHGSRSDNNPHHAGLECGACGGQSGAVNAALAARLFNDPAVREELAEQGIVIPEATRGVAAEHCTLTDTFHWLDSERIPEGLADEFRLLQEAFSRAGVAARRERATALGLNGLDDASLLKKLHQRSDDWSEVRPEWGLANNAAIIFAPRERTRGRNLSGRTFLHEYDAELDPQGDILTALLSAPMVVANWINMQYFASVTAPGVYGAGNKLLHSVIGGNLGVIEGNNPQLRVGLSLQSVHDGQFWRHEPVRLTVVVDAPRERIGQVLQSQPDVAHLVDNQWVLLHRLTATGIEAYRGGEWCPAPGV